MKLTDGVLAGGRVLAEKVYKCGFKKDTIKASSNTESMT